MHARDPQAETEGIITVEDLKDIAAISFDPAVLLQLDIDRIASLAQASNFEIDAVDLFKAERDAYRAAEGIQTTLTATLNPSSPAPVRWAKVMDAFLSSARRYKLERYPEGQRGQFDPGPVTARTIEYLWHANQALGFHCIQTEGASHALTRIHFLRLGIISNGVNELEDMLRRTKLMPFFEPYAIIDGLRMGFRKPDRRMFQTLADRLRLLPERVLHVGTSFTEDYFGALDAGMKAALYDPFDAWRDTPLITRDIKRTTSLDQLVDTMVSAKRMSVLPPPAVTSEESQRKDPTVPPSGRLPLFPTS